MLPIAISHCPDYEKDHLRQSLAEVIAATGGFDFVKPGMTVALKTNLVAGAAPDKAVVTHPALLAVLTEMLVERGASVVIGDSPGGPFSEGMLKKVYKVSGLAEAEAAGARLNDNFSQEDHAFPQGLIMKQVTCTSWLREADAIIGVCKLKTHGMMRLSANVKNFFGTIPGTMKLEYHYRFPKHEDFANMLIDINEFLKPSLYITDAVVGMEGNGPTAGTPRPIGAVLASQDPYALDILCARLIGLAPMDVPTIAAAARRGLGPYPSKAAAEADRKAGRGPQSGGDAGTLPRLFEEGSVIGEWHSLVISDYQNITTPDAITFSNRIPGFLVPLAKKLLQARPGVRALECIGCARCHDICPAKAITMENKLPVIDRSLCIRCFCCQEFCPKGAMKVKRTALARLLNRL